MHLFYIQQIAELLSTAHAIYRENMEESLLTCWLGLWKELVQLH